MRMRRGQAFETMMLVISVIVALAILAVLTGILQGINIGTNDPKSAIKGQLSEVARVGYGIKTPVDVDLKKDTIITKKEVLGDTSADPSLVTFFCGASSTDICASGKAIVPSTAGSSQIVTITQNVKAKAVVCGNSDRSGTVSSTAPLYCIIFARTAKDATDTCLAKCPQ